MAKRRKSGFFDPDYRKRGWNQSKYAPKNSRTSMSQTAAVFAILCSFPLFYIAYLSRDTYVIGGAFVGFFVLWFLFAMWIRKREWRRIQKVMDKENQPIDINKTRQRLRNKDLDLNNLNAKDFEHECAWLLNTLSNYKAVVVGGAGDDGVDIELYQAGRLVGIAQCKYYDSKRVLSPSHVRELAGAREAVNVRIAHLFTTARCTDKTKKIAAEYGIKVFDGDQVEAMRAKAKLKSRYGGSVAVARR
jgi:hypothetical protein